MKTLPALALILAAVPAWAQQPPCKDAYRAGEPIPAYCRQPISGHWSQWDTGQRATSPYPAPNNDPVLPQSWREKMNGVGR
jgi:hypothetical protein